MYDTLRAWTHPRRILSTARADHTTAGIATIARSNGIGTRR